MARPLQCASVLVGEAGSQLAPRVSPLSVYSDGSGRSHSSTFGFTPT